jgi:hypothetical protein
MVWAGIAIVATRDGVVKVLRESKAFDESTAVDPEEAGINYKRVLNLMEQGGLIGRTSEGKIYLTEKGRKKLL